MKFLKGVAIFIGVAVIIGLIYVFAVAVPDLDRRMNPVRDHAPYKVSIKAQKLHDSLFVADLHADTLLWRRNPTHKHDYGHVDLPRLREGGVNLQVFSSVTKSPRGLNFDGNSAEAPDDITLLSMVQLWPARTWGSIYERAAFQAHRLQKIESDTKQNFKIVRTRSDLKNPDGKLLGLLATEGSHPLEGDLENIQNLYDEGYRMMGLQHFFDNKLGGSLHGRTKSGLTPFGREAVLKMSEMNIIIDVAHSSEQTILDVLKTTDDTLIISHGGLASHCPRTANRNMPDDILIEIARRKGLIGIGYFKGAICKISPAGIADTIKAAINLLGEDAVSLGSDYDGTVGVALDTSELAAITQALLDVGLSEAQIRKVMGGNVKRFLSENLPE